MKNKATTIFSARNWVVILAACLLCGCTMTGDSLVNATDGKITIIVHSLDGHVREYALGSHDTITERRNSPGDNRATYENVEVLSADGNIIGEWRFRGIQIIRPVYGKYLKFIVTNTGIFPVPNEYWNSPESHIAEITEFYNNKFGEPKKI